MRNINLVKQVGPLPLNKPRGRSLLEQEQSVSKIILEFGKRCNNLNMYSSQCTHNGKTVNLLTSQLKGLDYHSNQSKSRIRYTKQS